MRLLHVIEFFTQAKGGPVQVAYHLCKNLAERGHEVVLWTSDFGLESGAFSELPFEVKVHKSIISKWNFYVTPSLIRTAQQELTGFDVVHMHDLRTFQNAVVERLCQQMDIPYVISPHGSLPYLGSRELGKKMFDLAAGQRLVKNAARLIAVSPTEEQQFIEFGIPRERIAMVYNGLDMEEYAQLPPKGTFRRKYGIGDSTKVILFLGRLHKRKGINFLIDAFTLLRKTMPESLLVIAGPDDGELDRLKKQVALLQLENDVLFTGPLYGEEKKAAYVDADVLAHPAVNEIFGLVPFEALLCGTPVIVADDGGSGRILGNIQAAYLVPFGDSGALANALRDALMDGETSRIMVASGQSFIHKELRWETAAQKTESIYRTIFYSGNNPLFAR